jgi:hypothetical protein
MYLVFDLPEVGEDKFPSAHTIAFWLHREFDLWATHHEVAYKTKFHKNKLRLIMNSDSDYHFFMLSWNPDFSLLPGFHKIDPVWSKPQIINPPKH